MRQRILLSIFLWAGTKLFNVVAIYPNDGENIEAVHFGINEQAIARSLEDFAENSIK